MEKAFNSVKGGDTVYFRGGVYQTTVLDGTGTYEETNGTDII